MIHHVADEETILLPEAERVLGASRLNKLGVQMTKRRLALLAPKAGKVGFNTLVGFSSSTTALVLGGVGALLLGRMLTKKMV